MDRNFDRVWQELHPAHLPASQEGTSRLTEDNFNTLFGASPNAIIICRQEDGRILAVNQAFERLFGYNCAEVCDRTPIDLNLYANDTDWQRIQAEVAVHGPIRGHEIDIRTKSDEILQARLALEMITSHGHPCLLTILYDITPCGQPKDSLHLIPEHTRSLAEIMPAAMFTCDSEGLITYYNQRAAELWGRRPKLHHPDDRYCGSTRMYRPDGSLLPHNECPMAVAVRTGHGVRNEEVHIERPDGTVVVASVNIDALYNQAGRHTGAINVFEDITQRKQADVERERLLADLAQERERLKALTDTLEERVLARTKQVRTLAARLSLAEQAERKRIAQILHDHIQQMLYGAQMRMHVMASEVPEESSESFRIHVQEMKRLLAEAAKAVHTLSVELSPLVLGNENFSEAVIWLAERMKELHALQVVVTVPDECRIADLDQRTMLFQIMRELLFNAVKHAKTDHAFVTLCRNDQSVIVTIRDQGRGFDTAAIFPHDDKYTGLGLFSIRERLDLLGGDMDIYSEPGAGTRVRIVLPLH